MSQIRIENLRKEYIERRRRLRKNEPHEKGACDFCGVHVVLDGVNLEFEEGEMVCILGPTSSAHTGPYGTDATTLQADLPCVPCYLRRLSQCRFNHRCMREISAAEVGRAVAAVLQNTRSTADKQLEQSVPLWDR